MDKIWYNIFRNTAKELNIPLNNIEVEEVFDSQFKFMVHKYAEIDIHTQDLPTILIPEIGRFYGKRVKTKNVRNRKINKELKLKEQEDNDNRKNKDGENSN